MNGHDELADLIRDTLATPPVRGRQDANRGEGRGRWLLPEEREEIIRRLRAGDMCKTLALEFDVSMSRVWGIKRHHVGCGPHGGFRPGSGRKPGSGKKRRLRTETPRHRLSTPWGARGRPTRVR